MPAGVSAYVPLANLTLGASATSVTFSSINQTYKDLIIVIDNAKSLSGTLNAGFRFNGDTAANYTYVNVYGSGTTSATATQTLAYGNLAGGTDYLVTNAVWNSIVNIMDYSTTDKHKTVLSRANRAITGAGGGGTSMAVNRWANTAAVTTIALSPEFTGSWATGTTFALYGVSA